MKRNVLISFLIVATLLLFSSMAFAAEIYVDGTEGADDGSSPFATIGAAISNSAAGDTIYICAYEDGTSAYTEDQLDFGTKGLTVVGVTADSGAVASDLSDAPIVQDGTVDANPIVALGAADQTVVIQNIIFQDDQENAGADDAVAIVTGNAISGTNYLSINNCKFEAWDEDNPIIDVDHAIDSLSITGCTFDQDDATSNSDVIDVDAALTDTITVSGNTVTNAGTGAFVSLVDLTGLVLVDNNSVTVADGVDGAGITVANTNDAATEVWVTNNTFVNAENTFGTAGSDDIDYLYINDNNFSGSAATAALDYNTLANDIDSLVVKNNVFGEDYDSDEDGTCLAVTSDNLLVMEEGNIISGNTITGTYISLPLSDGGADGTDVLLGNLLITGNTFNSAGIYFDMVDASDADAAFENIDIVYNTFSGTIQDNTLLDAFIEFDRTAAYNFTNDLSTDIRIALNKFDGTVSTTANGYSTGVIGLQALLAADGTVDADSNFWGKSTGPQVWNENATEEENDAGTGSWLQYDRTTSAGLDYLPWKLESDLTGQPGKDDAQGGIPAQITFTTDEYEEVAGASTDLPTLTATLTDVDGNPIDQHLRDAGTLTDASFAFTVPSGESTVDNAGSGLATDDGEQTTEFQPAVKAGDNTIKVVVTETAICDGTLAPNLSVSATREIEVVPDVLAQVQLTDSGHDYEVTSADSVGDYYGIKAIKDTVAEEIYVIATLMDKYENQIDASDVSEVSFSVQDNSDDGTLTTIGSASLNSDNDIKVAVTLGDTATAMTAGETDSLFVTTTTGSYVDGLEITKVAGVAESIGHFWVSAGDSILEAGTETETISVDSVYDAYGNFVGDNGSVDAVFESSGDLTFANGLTKDTVTVANVGAHTGGSTVDLAATGGKIAGTETLTATIGNATSSFDVTDIVQTIDQNNVDSLSLVSDISNPVAGQTVTLTLRVFDEYGNRTEINNTLLDSIWRAEEYDVLFDLADTGSTPAAVGKGSFDSDADSDNDIENAEADTTGGSTGELTTKYTPWTGGADSASIVVDLNGVKDTLVIESAENDALKMFELTSSDDSIRTTSTMSFLVTAYDSNDVVKSNYVDSVHITVKGSANPNLYFPSTGVMFDGDTVDATGSVDVPVDSNSFSGGTFTFAIKDTLAETFDVIFTDVTTGIADTLKNVDFYPGIPDSIMLGKPDDIYAGTEYDYTATPVDMYGNVNTEHDVKFKMTAKDPDIMDIADNTRFIKGPEVYTLTASDEIAQQWLKYYDAFWSNDGGDSWNGMADDHGRTETFEIKAEDNDPPAITITEPEDGEVFGTTDVDVAGSFVDSSSVTATVNGHAVTLTNNAFTHTETFADFEGDTTIVVEATDAMDNMSDTTLHVTVDTTKPMIANVGPADSSTVREAMPEMCFWAKDEVSEVDTNTAVMTLDGDTVATTVTEPEDGGYRFAYTPSDSLTNGWYQLTVYVEDMAGHMVDSTVDFEVDLNMLGDVDFDDEITTIDANNVLEYAANMHPSWDGTDTLEVADVTGDGNVGAYDAAQIFKYALGVDTTFAPLAKKAAAYASMSFSKAMSTGKEAVVAVPVRIDEARNVYSVEITAEIDPAVVEVSGIETALPDGWMVAQNIEDGVVHLAMAGLEPIKSATIANLKLNVLDKEASAELTGNVVVNENRSKNLESVSIKAIPEEFKLSNNYPNPFNPTTTINYQLPKSSKVVITVYDLLGHRVKTLVNKNMEAGYYSVIWNGKNESGKTLSSGTYFYHIKAGKNSATKKMLLMK